MATKKEIKELTKQITFAYDEKFLKKQGLPKNEINTFMGYKLFPIGILVKADWNYKEQNDFTAQQLQNNLKRIGQVETIQVRLLESGLYEVINGNHRYDELINLQTEYVIAYDHGDIGLQEAIRRAIETNETKFKADELELSKRVVDLLNDKDIDELNLTLPYSEQQLEDFGEMVNFDMNGIGGGPRPTTVTKTELGGLRRDGIVIYNIKVPSEHATEFEKYLIDNQEALNIKVQ